MQRIYSLMPPIAVVAVIAVSGVITLSARAQCVPAPTGLVSWWRAESNTRDQVGINNGTLVGNATYGPGKVGRGFVFDGNSSAVNVANDASLNSQDFTVEAWIQRARSNIVTFNYTGAAHLLDAGSSAYYFAIANNGSVSVGQNWVSGFTAGPRITDTAWHHVAATKSGTNAVLYIDGTGYPLPPFPGTFLFNAPFTIGAYVNYDFSFIGTIDEMAIYNRGLSAAEIQAIYNAGSAGKCMICNPATATAEVVNGFVVGATVTHFGCGYTNTPLVAFQGGGGTGAAATAVLSNDFVEGITITSAGNGYTNPPTIVIGFPPIIAVEPQSIIANYGDNVSFNFTPADPTAVAYQWLFNSKSIPGATSSTLVVSNVVQTNLGAYSVVLTSPFGTTNSSEAILSMYPFLTGPFGGAVTYWGMAAMLSVQAVGSDQLSYQWYHDGVAVPNGTNAALSFGAIQFTNAGLYSVIVSNPYGSVTNAPAQVVVNPAGVSLGLYPGITINGAVGYHYTVQRTADLSNTNAWVIMTNLTLAAPVELWVDTSVDASLPANPHHFYRVLPGQ